MLPGLNSLLLSTVVVWHHISYQVVYWEARLIFWQAGCGAALQPTQYLALNSPKRRILGQNFPAGCILLLPSRSRRWVLVCSWQRHLTLPSPTLAGLPCCLISAPISPLWYVAPDNCLVDLSPKSFYLLSSLLPSHSYAENSVSQLVDTQCGAMLNCLPWRRSPPRGTSASASYHVLVSQRLSNNN